MNLEPNAGRRRLGLPYLAVALVLATGGMSLTAPRSAVAAGRNCENNPEARMCVAQLSAKFKTCFSESTQGNSFANAGDLIDCYEAETAIQDAKLNEAYRAAMGVRSPEQKTVLRDDERAWIKRRDALCAVTADADTLESRDSSACKMNATIARLLYLRDLINPTPTR